MFDSAALNHFSHLAIDTETMKMQRCSFSSRLKLQPEAPSIAPRRRRRPMPFSFSRRLRPTILALAIGLVGTAAPRPAEAMCGGNILLTCRPPAKATQAAVGNRAKSQNRRASRKTAIR